MAKARRSDRSMPGNPPEDRRDDSASPRPDEAARTPRVRFIGETYRLLFEKNPLPMWVYDVKSLYFLAVNDAAVARYGYSRNEFLRMTVKDIRPQEDIPRFLEDIARLDSATESIGIWRHVKRDGAIIDVEVRSNEIDFDGHRARLVLANDVTERLRAERRLRTEYAVTRVLMESPSFQQAIPWLLRSVCEEAAWEYGEIWRTSPDRASLRWEGAWHVPGLESGRLEEASRTIPVVRGVGIPGTTWATGHPEWLDELSERTQFARAHAAKGLGLRQGISFPIRGRGRQVLGVMVFLSRTTREPDPEFLDLMEDLGDRMGHAIEAEGLERERRILEVRFSRAFHENPAAASITRLRDGMIIDANDAFLRAIEYARDEVIGHSSRDILLWSEPGQRERILEPLGRGEHVHGAEEIFRTKSGRTWTALVFVEPISLADEPTILTTLVDVTDLRAAERRAIESERLAAIGRTASFVAHELNTPLTNIALLTASLRRQTADPPLLERLDRIDAQRKVATRIIEEVLTFTHSTSMKKEESDLRELLRDAAEQADPYRVPEVALSLNLGDAAVPAVVDPFKMSQVFVNLIKNAFQATAQGTVTVALERDAGAATVVVRDTGKGMTPVERERLFQPFFTTKARGKGVGLGLAFAKTVVDAHDGRIDVDTSPERGTTFTVRIPMAPPAQ